MSNKSTPDFGLLRAAIEHQYSNHADELERASWESLRTHLLLTQAIQELVGQGIDPGEIASRAEDFGAGPMLQSTILMAARYAVRMKPW
jgi:hypothetical protein